MSDNSMNDEQRRAAEMSRVGSECFNSAGTNFQHLLPPQFFTQQMYYPYVNPYSHLTEANGNLAIHGYGSDGRPKFRRSRTIFNTEQLDVLEQHFQKHKYPDVKHRKKISEEIGLPEERIQIWFQNRRAKDKRQMEQQVKLQKLVDEAIGGTQETNRTHNNTETGPSAVCLHNPVEQLNQLSQHDIKMEEGRAQPEPETSNSIQELTHSAYIDGKSIIFPEETEQQLEKAVENSTKWPNNGVEAPEPQVSIQNIDQELLFKVANILSASNDAAQLITDWSHSPNKLQTNSLEEQLRHFAEHHQKVLANSEPSSTLNIPQGGLEKCQQ